MWLACRHAVKHGRHARIAEQLDADARQREGSIRPDMTDGWVIQAQGVPASRVASGRTRLRCQITCGTVPSRSGRHGGRMSRSFRHSAVRTAIGMPRALRRQRALVHQERPDCDIVAGLGGQSSATIADRITHAMRGTGTPGRRGGVPRTRTLAAGTALKATIISPCYTRVSGIRDLRRRSPGSLSL